jgi:hypothetical protein
MNRSNLEVRNFFRKKIMAELFVFGGVFFTLYSLLKALIGSEHEFSLSSFNPSSLLAFDSDDIAVTPHLSPDYFDLTRNDDGDMMPELRKGYAGDGMPPSADNDFQQYIGKDIHEGMFEQNDFQVFEVDMFGGGGMSDFGCSSDFSISSCDALSFDFD